MQRAPDWKSVTHKHRKKHPTAAKWKHTAIIYNLDLCAPQQWIAASLVSQDHSPQDTIQWHWNQCTWHCYTLLICGFIKLSSPSKRWPELWTQWSAFQSQVLSVMTQPLLTSSIVSTPAGQQSHWYEGGRSWVCHVDFGKRFHRLYHQIEPSNVNCQHE